MIRIEALAVAGKPRARLAALTLALAPGQLVGVVGSNGAGKSTLLKAIAGLVGHEGRISVFGSDVTGMPAHRRARHLGYLAQERIMPWPLLPAEVVQLGYSAALSSDVIDAVLGDVDAQSFKDRVVTGLSGGERARVLLARLLVNPALLWLLDEPLAGLDIRHQIEIMRLLKNRADDGRLIFSAMHELTLAARFCDQLLLLDSGELIAAGSPAMVLSDANLARAFGVRRDASGFDIVLDQNLPDKA